MFFPLPYYSPSPFLALLLPIHSSPLRPHLVAGLRSGSRPPSARRNFGGRAGLLTRWLC
uniref:Uncharacterized protein n=1 Tax=Triticum urartu TaxID=4572 RepID=A0A8R7PQI8_TRIUA